MFGIIGPQILLLLWIPVTLLIFASLPALRAMVASAIAGWLLLPPTGIDLPGLPDYTKTTAVVLSILLATIIFQPGRIFDFRPRWFDLPMITFAICPFFSSISNGLGPYDGIASMVGQCLNWLLPYWIGRVYLSDAASFRELGLGMIIGGLCLIPLCLIELRLGPTFQRGLYGIGRWEGMRLGGFRPLIFFTTGLDLGLWMNAVTLVAWWFWRTGQFKELRGIPSGAIFALLLVITILCRATGATFLLGSGFLALMISLRTGTKWALWGLLLIAPFFYIVRTTNLWSGESAVEVTRSIFGDARADSLDVRFENDQLLIAKALQQPIFGWGGWNRNRVTNEWGEDVAATDGYWIIVFGILGFVGLISLTLAMLLPALIFLLRFPVTRWTQPDLAPVTVIITIVNLFLIDCLVNAMPNLIYVIAAGSIFNIIGTRTHPGSSGHGAGTQAATAVSWETLASQYRLLGRVAKDQGQFVDARTSWLHAIDLLSELLEAHPDRSDLRRRWCDCANDLAWLLANARDAELRDPTLAVSLSAKATEMYPDCNTYWNSLGAAHYRAGELDAANVALERSVTLDNGGSPFDHVFLSMIQARWGNYEQAHRWLSEAVRLMDRLYPNHPELRGLCVEATSLLSAAPKT